MTIELITNQISQTAIIHNSLFIQEKVLFTKMVNESINIQNIGKYLVVMAVTKTFVGNAVPHMIFTENLCRATLHPKEI